MADLGSGNLPTEKVHKRDLFYIFHKHGRLAQVSIKQAYGFVQFLDADACYRALQAEQGSSVRGRKMREFCSEPTEVDHADSFKQIWRYPNRKRVVEAAVVTKEVDQLPIVDLAPPIIREVRLRLAVQISEEEGIG